jgi:hypothetical protein
MRAAPVSSSTCRSRPSLDRRRSAAEAPNIPTPALAPPAFKRSPPCSSVDQRIRRAPATPDDDAPDPAIPTAPPTAADLPARARETRGRPAVRFWRAEIDPAPQSATMAPQPRQRHQAAPMMLSHEALVPSAGANERCEGRNSFARANSSADFRRTREASQPHRTRPGNVRGSGLRGER